MEDHPAHVLFEGTVKASIVLYRFLATTSPYRRQVGTHFPTSRLRLRRARWDFTQTPHLLSKISLKMLLGLWQQHTGGRQVEAYRVTSWWPGKDPGSVRCQKWPFQSSKNLAAPVSHLSLHVGFSIGRAIHAGSGFGVFFLWCSNITVQPFVRTAMCQCKCIHSIWSIFCLTTALMALVFLYRCLQIHIRRLNFCPSSRVVKVLQYLCVDNPWVPATIFHFLGSEWEDCLELHCILWTVRHFVAVEISLGKGTILCSPPRIPHQKWVRSKQLTKKDQIWGC